MPMLFFVKFFKGLGAIILMLSLIILGLLFILAPGLAANLFYVFFKAAE